MRKNVKKLKDILSKEDLKKWNKCIVKGNKLVKSKKTIPAGIIEFKKALKLYPKNFQLNLIIGGNYSDINQIKKAIKYYERAIKIEPKKTNGWYQLGYAYFRLQQNHKAIKCYQKAIKINKKYKNAWHELAHCYFALKNFKKAEECSKIDIKLGKNSGHHWEIYGDVLFQRDKYKEAITAYENAIKKKKDNAIVMANIGVSYYRIGKITQAKSYLEKANDILKNNSSILHFLGHVNSDLGKYFEAVNFFNLEIKIRKKSNSETLFELGKAYFGLKKFKDAEKCFKNSLKLEESLEAWIKLAESYASQKKFKESSATYKKIYKLKKKKKSVKKKSIPKKIIPIISTIHEITPAPIKEKNVFVVYGHDTSTLRTVSKFIDEKMGLNPLLLDKLPAHGRYLMEKIEDYLSESGFVVVLLTPDDIGYPKKKVNRDNHRARQNVILEYGLSRGKLGRNKICILYKGKVELPTDILGVNYVPIDNTGKWKVLLKADLKHANMQIGKK